MDVLASLEAILKQNTGFYQSDFDIDKRIIAEKAASPNKEDKTLLWLSRPSGTYCFRERDVFLKDTREHNTWKFYGATPDELAEFLAAVADVISTISPDDENYDFFTTTISFSSQELYGEHMGEEFFISMPLSKLSRPCDYLDDEGETVYDFTCFVDATAVYSIQAPKFVSVAERDKALLTFKEEMQNYLNGLSEEEIVGGDIKKMLTDKSTVLSNSLSTENMKLSSCDIYMIQIHNAGTEITK